MATSKCLDIWPFMSTIDENWPSSERKNLYNTTRSAFHNWKTKKHIISIRYSRNGCQCFREMEQWVGEEAWKSNLLWLVGLA